MANIAVVGGQWGDEGKGKIVDLLAERFDIVARWQGGPNAGHTVRASGKRYAVHHIPTGILRAGATAVIGNGTVVNPVSLLEEIVGLEKEGIDVRSRLKLSYRAHVILPYHIELDRVSEDSAKGAAIGTTRRGVGPAYMAKIGRLGVRLVDLGEEDGLRSLIRTYLAAGPGSLLAERGAAIEDPEKVAREFHAHGQSLAGCICDTALWLSDRIASGDRVLFEGAQGALLDVDHGSYPYVTSSSTVAGGLSPGLGVGPRQIDGIVGVFKAYTTRVGAGPFPTEDRGETGNRLRERGHEYGTTTGRPRRCGWFDGVAARYAARINGLDAIAVTLLDVLDEFDEIPVCVAYRYRGMELTDLPAEPWVVAQAEPVFERLPGWRRPTVDARRPEDLPDEARAYIDRLSALTGCEVAIVSVGADREQTIVCSDRLWSDNSPAR